MPGLNRIPKIVLPIAALLLMAIGLEVFSRVWVAVRSERWPESKIANLTQLPEARAGYVSDPQVGYRPEPSRSRTDSGGKTFTHNELGFRGASFSEHKPPGTMRVVLMGASTVYGIYVDDQDTSSSQLQRLLEPELGGASIEVINAGVPGWTSRETALSLQHRVLALSPDVVVVMDGRNEAFPQAFLDYRDDYSHYRRIGFDFRRANAGYKRVFRASYFAMLLCTVRAGDGRLGFSFRAQHPAYGYVRWENRPDHAALIENAKDERLTSGFKNNLESLVDLATGRGVDVVLASIPFNEERFASGHFERDPEILPSLKTMVTRNNRVTRDVARDHSLAFVDGESLTRPELLHDDCHFNADGERALAALMAEAVLPLLEQRVEPASGL